MAGGEEELVSWAHPWAWLSQPMALCPRRGNPREGNTLSSAALAAELLRGERGSAVTHPPALGPAL